MNRSSPWWSHNPQPLTLWRSASQTEELTPSRGPFKSCCSSFSLSRTLAPDYRTICLHHFPQDTDGCPYLEAPPTLLLPPNRTHNNQLNNEKKNQELFPLNWFFKEIEQKITQQFYHCILKCTNIFLKYAQRSKLKSNFGNYFLCSFFDINTIF